MKSFAIVAMLTTISSVSVLANNQPIEPVLVPLINEQQNINIQMGKYEVTVAEFSRFADATNFQITEECHLYNEKHTPAKKHGTWNNPDLTKQPYRPVVCLGAKDAMAYATWLAKETGKPYRLAKFNEWQYASTAGKTSRYAFGDDLRHSEVCNYENVDDFAHNAGLKKHHGYRNRFGANCNDGATYHTVVGMYRPNDLGLHDIMGNVREITQSCYDSNIEAKQQCKTYVVAGGAWHWLPHPEHMKNPMMFVGSIEGFRLVLDSSNSNPTSEQTQAFIDGLVTAQQHAKLSHQNLKDLPNKVTGVSATLGKNQQVKITWAASTNEGVSYSLYRSYLDINGKVSRKMINIADGIKSTEYIDNLPGKGAASYQVFANNGVGESQPSKEVVVGQHKAFKVGELIQAEYYQNHRKADIISDKQQDSVFLSSNDGHYPPGMYPYSPAWLSYQFDSKHSGSAKLTLNARGQRGAVLEFWQGKDLIATVKLDGARELKQFSVAAQLNAGKEPIQVRGADNNFVILDWFTLEKM